MRFRLVVLNLSIIILGLYGMEVQAEWKLYAEMDGGQGFYDPSTIQKVSNNKFNVTTYINLPEEKMVYEPKNGKKITFSNKVIQQYDCTNRTYQFLETELYSAYDLKGEVVRKSKNTMKTPNKIGDGSPAVSLIKILCATKGRS